jgi:hypothetical protein
MDLCRASRDQHGGEIQRVANEAAPDRHHASALWEEGDVRTQARGEGRGKAEGTHSFERFVWWESGCLGIPHRAGNLRESTIHTTNLPGSMSRLTALLLLLAVSDASALILQHARVGRATGTAVQMSAPEAGEETLASPVVSMPKMTEMELAEQSAKLDALAAKWRRRQQQQEDDEAKRAGWAVSSEQVNGRFAMFFLLVGLVTEYYTGESVPQQCYTMLQTLGLADVRSPRTERTPARAPTHALARSNHHAWGQSNTHHLDMHTP